MVYLGAAGCFPPFLSLVCEMRRTVKLAKVVTRTVMIHRIPEEIKFGDWVAVDYDTGTLYIGEVANLTTEGGETRIFPEQNGCKQLQTKAK